MKKYFAILILLACALFTACTSSSRPLTDTQKSEIEKHVLEQWGKISTAVEKADAGTYCSFLGDDFLGMYSEGLLLGTKAQYADSIKSWFGSRTGTTLEQRDIKVSVLSAGFVLLDQTSLLSAIYKNGKVERCNHMVSFIFKKEAGGWMIIHGNETWKDI